MSDKLTFVARLNYYGFIKLLPYSNGLVVRPCHNEIGKIADGEGPNFTVVSLKLLNVLKLYHLVLALEEHS